MKRYALAKIMQIDDPNTGPVWKHKLQLSGNVWFEDGGIEMDTSVTPAVPKHPASLVLIGSKDHVKLRTDPDLVLLPHVVPDMKISAIHTPTRLAAIAAIKGLGFSEQEVDTVFSGADGFRDVLNHFGRKNNATFDVDNFDLDDAG